MLRWIAFAIAVLLLLQVDWIAVAAGWLGLTPPASLVGVAEAKEAPGVQFGLWPAWLGFLLLLPVATMSFLRSVARKRNSALNAYMLALYVGATAVGALVVGMLDGRMPGMLGWLAILVGSSAYVFASLSLATHLES